MKLIDADAFVKMMEEKCDHSKQLDEWVLSVCRGGIKMMPPVNVADVIPDKVITELTQMSNALDCQTPCNDMYRCGWCEKNCKWKDPQEECWRKWVEWLQKGEPHEKDW